MTNENQPVERPPSIWISYRWPLVLVTLAVLMLAGMVIFFRLTKTAFWETVDRGGQAGRFVAEQAVQIAEKFQQGTITRTFLAALPEISTTGSGNLELALSRQTEIFRAEDELNIFWDKIPLGKTVSEIRVPVTYRYHLRLADEWRLEVSAQTCIVRAPRIRPSVPPAIHTDQMEKNSQNGWARFNARDQLTDLEKSITPTITLYARDHRHMALVRDECRKTVAEFVKAWLLKEDHWRKDRFHTIKVIFGDEIQVTPESAMPTVELKVEP